MKYIVDVKDISYGRIEVEADSVEEAQEKAEELYFSGHVPWTDCDVSYEAQPDFRTPRYFDRNGNEIKPGMQLGFANGRTEQVYETTDQDGRPDLGISATNEAFLKNHPDWDREYYSLSTIDLDGVEIDPAGLDFSGRQADKNRGDAR